MNVDAVEQRPGDFRNVALDHRRCAVALAGSVVVESARAGVHGRRKHKTRREGQRHGRPRDADRAVFERLAHHFKHVAREFGKLVEKQNAIVSERHFSRPRDRSPADQPGVGDGVMRRAERAPADQSGARVQNSGHAMDLGGLQRFFERRRRQDRRYALRQHRFS